VIEDIIYAGGSFTSIGGLLQPSIAAISQRSTTAAPMDRETPSRSDLVLLSANPTSGGARVQYDVARTGRVRLEVLDVSGRVEESLADRSTLPDAMSSPGMALAGVGGVPRTLFHSPRGAGRPGDDDKARDHPVASILEATPGVGPRSQ